MAKRYGGKYSPGQGGRAGVAPEKLAPEPGLSWESVPVARPEGRAPGEWRAFLLFLLSFAFLFPAFGDAPSAMLLGLLAGGTLILAAWLTREGMRARAAFESRKVARRPAFPRIAAGAVATGVALALGGVIGQGLTLIPLLYGLIGAGLHFGAFGADPLHDKGMEGIDRFQTDRVARAVTEAEKTLTQMKDAILRAGDATLEARVDTFVQSARALFRRVEEDPGDLTAARKYLSVYLTGARDATVKFADLWANTKDPKARADYEALLTDLETTFAERSKALLQNDHTDLDIEISVLRDRLKFETR